METFFVLTLHPNLKTSNKFHNDEKGTFPNYCNSRNRSYGL